MDLLREIAILILPNLKRKVCGGKYGIDTKKGSL